MMQAISVTILTKNSQQHLAACLQALQRFAEVIVLDNGSTDQTLAIAAGFPNVRIVEHPFTGFGPMKNLAAQHATHPWVLSIDSDEVLSPELAAEILRLDLLDTRKVYSFLRHNFYGKKHIKACGWDNDYVLRLYHKGTTRFADLPVHEYIQTDGLQVQALRGTMDHFSFNSISQLIGKMDQYTTLFAREQRFRKSSSPAKSYFKWAFSLFRNYVLQRGFLYGYEGMAISFSNANGTFYKYMKLHEENQRLGISLVITTYNWKEALGTVLRSVFSQSELPREIIVADDGSRDDTRALVESLAKESPVPLLHSWQEDLGFRAAESRNRGIALATGEYVVIIDGDMVLHPDFLKGHRRAARKGYFTQGKRVLLSPELSQDLIRRGPVPISPLSAGIKNRLNATNSPFLSKLFSKDKAGISSIKSCNMGFWMEDIVRVNGFNEDFVGWGREDSEFAIRLLNSGTKRQNLAFGGIAYHLNHQENSRQSLAANDVLMERAISEKSTYCPNGIDKHLIKK
ncbi:glycosyltransferase family 2 protein [Pontibacter indicus]|uniref:Glycosyltransferase, GT2 family n=1 Tax=Pontibacter indicus TaxID=1317125 RepID=A0A1R3XHT5_9BACT|nr:glycosyltransferase [Pontibacter indicus]SIT91041.1 Glycosyltransferase, GT2 family [Pontibacter indicus]